MKEDLINQLKVIWKDVFCDEDSYLELFFDKIYVEDKSLIIKDNDKAAAMLYMIPYEVKIKEKRFKSIYLYALATVEEYRNKGFMSELIRQANDYADNNDYMFSFLIPADKELAGFYNRFGFDTNINIDNIFKEGINTDYVNYKSQIEKYENAIILNQNQFDVWKYIYDESIKSKEQFINELTPGLMRKCKMAETQKIDLKDIYIGKILC